VPVYVFAIWDSYRLTVVQNKFAALAEQKRQHVDPVSINPLETNFLVKRAPWVSAAWSLIMPGAGHLYNQRLITGFFLMFFWILASFYSNVLEAIHCTFTGDFGLAAAVTSPEWLLFSPSVYAFSVYDSYVHNLEKNKLFEYEQSIFLTENYQSPDFIMPDTN